MQRPPEVSGAQQLGDDAVNIRVIVCIRFVRRTVTSLKRGFRRREGSRAMGSPWSVDGVGCRSQRLRPVLYESDDAVAIGTWMPEWTDVLTFDAVPVGDDKEITEVLGG